MEVVAKSSTLTKKAVNDYELVKCAVEGDQQAYAKLMERHRHSIYHLMMKMSGDSAAAEDLTIEAFGKAFVRLQSYVPNFAFSTWLYKIAINNCIDYVRKRRLNTLSMDEPMGTEEDNQGFSSLLEADGLNPEEDIIRYQRIEKLRSLVNQLNKKYRLMIELRYYEEMSYDEISKELDLPLGTVKAQLFRAKELLFGMASQNACRAYFEAPYTKAVAG